MSSPAPNLLSTDPSLRPLLEEYAAAQAAGRPLGIDELIARHPELPPSARQALASLLYQPETLSPDAPAGHAGSSVDTSGQTLDSDPGAGVRSAADPTLSPPGGDVSARVLDNKFFGDYELL